jgi:hypothetical protein
MILLFLDLKGALFHSPLELNITVNPIQSQKHLGNCLHDESNPLKINMSSAMKGEPGLATGLTTMGEPHPFIRA